jgi:hypothetical protein
MQIGRTILAFLVALSLTANAGGFAEYRNASAGSSLVVTFSHDCNGDVAEGIQEDHDRILAKDGMNDCQTSASCYAKCFNFCGLTCPWAALQPLFVDAELEFTSRVLSPPAGTSPFRPPRR